MEREFKDPEPSVEEGRKLIDGSSVDKKPEEKKDDNNSDEIVTPVEGEVADEQIDY